MACGASMTMTIPKWSISISSTLPKTSIQFHHLHAQFSSIASISVNPNKLNQLFTYHHSTHASASPSFHLPLIRAHSSSSDYVPDAKFYKVEAILRPWRVPQVSKGLLKIGIRGVTISEVKGFGAQGSLTERQAGSEFSEDKFVAKVKMEIVVSKDQVEAVIDKIIEEARTGEIGDGKIFLMPVSDVIRIRTGKKYEQQVRGARRQKGWWAGGRICLVSLPIDWKVGRGAPL